MRVVGDFARSQGLVMLFGVALLPAVGCFVANPEFQNDRMQLDESDASETIALTTATATPGLESQEMSTLTVDESTSFVEESTEGHETSTSQTQDWTEELDGSGDDLLLDACLGPILLPVLDDHVEAPMKYVESAAWSAIPAAWVDSEIDGSVSFPFRMSCSAPVFVWSYVYDGWSGATSPDADSFYAELDGNTQANWIYGCTTYDSPVGFSWQRITHYPDDWTCSVASLAWVLDPADHVFQLRPRETKVDDSNFSAVAQVYVTTDPNAVPPAL